MTNKQKVEKWLDKQIKMKKDSVLTLNKNTHFSNLSITAGVANEIHINGVREIAKILEADVIDSPFHCRGTNYNNEYYFVYKGYKIFDLEEKNLKTQNILNTFKEEI